MVVYLVKIHKGHHKNLIQQVLDGRAKTVAGSLSDLVISAIVAGLNREPLLQI